jgi:hypothetical protein
MDYLTRQLLLVLTKIKDAFDKHNTTTDRIQKNAEQQTQIQRETSEKVLAAYNESERNRNVSEKRQYDVQNSNRYAAWLSAIATFGAVFAATWYACITRDMWKQVQKQTETAQRQLEQSERAWLKVSFVVQPPGITFQNGGMQLNITPRIENIGNSVATDVTTPMKIFLADDADMMFKQPLKRQKELCDGLAKQPVIHNQAWMAVVIFPHDNDSSVGSGLGLSKAEVDAAKDERIGVKGANMIGPKLLVPIVYGCIDYLYDTSDRHHQTQFILEVQQTNRTSTVPRRIPMIAIREGEPVDASNVVITKYPFGGFYAY